MLSAIELAYLPLVLTLSLIASYHDIKRRAVPNSLLAWGFLASLVLNLYISRRFSLSLLPFALLVLASFLFVYILYYFDLWGGGDAKFYFVLSTLTFPWSLSSAIYPFLILALLFLIAELVESLLSGKRPRIELDKSVFYASLSVLFPASLSISAPLFFILFSRYLEFVNPYLVFALSFLINPYSSVISVLAGALYKIFLDYLRGEGKLPATPLIALSFLLYIFLF